MLNVPYYYQFLGVSCSALVIFASLSLISVQGCIKSSMYYRSTVRSRSHAFVPKEYQPTQWEDSSDSSGPLSAHDIHYNIPAKQLVRVDSPDIVFASEQARWMTKGCRDRLLKLSTQIQNVWVSQDVVLKVIRAWVQPPPNYQFPYDQQQSSGNSDGSLLYRTDHEVRSGDMVNTLPLSGTEVNGFGSMQSTHRRETIPTDSVDNMHQPLHVNPPSVMDMTPDMIIREGQSSQVRNLQPSGDQSLTLPPGDNSVSQNYYSPHEGRQYRYQFGSSQSNGYQPWTPARSLRRRPLHASSNERPYVIYNNHVKSLPQKRGEGKEDRMFRQVVMNSAHSSVGIIRLPREATHDSPGASNAINIETPVTPRLKNNSTVRERHLPRKVSRSVSLMRAPPINHFRISHVNAMQRDRRFHEWLDLRMEEFHYAGRAIDIELTTRTFSLPVNHDHHLGVLAQMAYYVAQFDWCYFTQFGHIHCSVKPDASITSQWFGCFPGSALVQRDTGERIPINLLRVGDRIASWDPSSHERTTTTVTAFLHKDAHAWSPMLTISYIGLAPTTHLRPTGWLTLTPGHLVYVVDRYLSPMVIKAVFAALVQPNQTVILSTGRSEGMILAQVLNVKKNATPPQFGVYAPLTESGTLLVDDVFVSCFAHYFSHDVAYWATWPMTIIHKLKMLFLPDSTVGVQQHTGVHWYANKLFNIFSPWMSNSFFSLVHY